MDRTDSTEDVTAPLRECANLQARENTRTTPLIDTLKAFSKRKTVGMETPCPRSGEP